MRFKLFLLVLLSAVMPVLAQTQTVKGTVLDATTEQPLIGALVTAGSSNTGVTTDLDGNFTIVVPQQVNVITVSYVNFDSQSVRIAGNDLIVRLMPTAAETDYYGDSRGPHLRRGSPRRREREHPGHRRPHRLER